MISDIDRAAWREKLHRAIDKMMDLAYEDVSVEWKRGGILRPDLASGYYVCEASDGYTLMVAINGGDAIVDGPPISSFPKPQEEAHRA
ncbi:MAG TPA: hypothetical protein DCQ64_09360 [Candidatus Rokubacteria bacterium]|nr:hypothetical protein [Candidatus Rokubacteria bacterium]